MNVFIDIWNIIKQTIQSNFHLNSYFLLKPLNTFFLNFDIFLFFKMFLCYSLFLIIQFFHIATI